MKHNIKNIISAVILCFVSLGVSAQTLHSSYFLERMPYRHYMNPALINDYGYLSFPALGNIYVGANSNFGLSTFLYPSKTSNGLNTFLHSEVNAKDFLNELQDFTQELDDINLTVLSFGFFGFNGYNTFDLSVRSFSDISLPKSLFEFLKVGQTGEVTQYDMKDLSIKSNNYIELALGHAHRINDRLTIGAKFKFLVGGANLDAKIDQLNLYLNEDVWMIHSKGTAHLSLSGANVYTDRKGEINDFEFDTNKIGVAGFGGAIDLGATYKLMDNLTLSMALTDIGFIRWNKNEKGETPEGTIIYGGFDNIGAEDGPDGENPFDTEKDQLVDDLEALAKFYRTEAPSSRSTWLKTTLNIGAEYGILNNKISFGLLSSTRFSQPKTWTELMATVNLRPAKWFMAALNGSVSNMGCGWGGLINFCPRGFNLFIGADYIPTQFAPKYYAPINRAKLNFNFGINFPLGMDPKLKNRKVYNPVPAAY